MKNEKFKNQYRIPSARATWHNYDGGAYFVTICTEHHKCYFGEIINDEMLLSSIGQFIACNLQNISKHYQYAEISCFVVMPNHFHALIVIDSDKTHSGNKKFARQTGDAGGESGDAGEESGDAARHVSTVGNERMKGIADKSGLLSVCIGGIKSAVTKYANENHIDFGWQARFHDHIIRNDNEMNWIVEYIYNNVARWKNDCFYRA